VGSRGDTRGHEETREDAFRSHLVPTRRRLDGLGPLQATPRGAKVRRGRGRNWRNDGDDPGTPCRESSSRASRLLPRDAEPHEIGAQPRKPKVIVAPLARSPAAASEQVSSEIGQERCGDHHTKDEA
jgi:hypothetical protein